jgi:hypothetical protein
VEQVHWDLQLAALEPSAACPRHSTTILGFVQQATQELSLLFCLAAKVPVIIAELPIVVRFQSGIRALTQ